MQREIWRWYSPSVGQSMGVARYGHYGAPVVYFPTGGGDFLDGERFLLIDALAPLIDAGQIKVYAIDSVCRRSWTNPAVPPPDKSRIQAAYARYLEGELYPAIDSDCRGENLRLIACGASIGAYNALNAACRRPDRFTAMIGLSGTYAHDHRMGGHWDLDYYYNAPIDFVPNLRGPLLDQLRRVRFFFGLGEAHEHPPYTWRAAEALGAVGVGNWVERWGPGSGHDWPTWRAMLPRLLTAVLP